MRSTHRAVCLAGALCVLSAQASSQSPPTLSDDTKRFVAVALGASNFIDEACNTALANGGSPALQQFAHSAIKEQAAVRARLQPWAYVLQPTPAPPIVYENMWDSGPIGLAFLPLNAAVAATSFVIYRSFDVMAGGVVLQSDAQAQLEHMQGLSGGDFNRDYRHSQAAIYRSLLETYRTYAERGDEPAIRRLARLELPIIERQLRRIAH